MKRRWYDRFHDTYDGYDRYDWHEGYAEPEPDDPRVVWLATRRAVLPFVPPREGRSAPGAPVFRFSAL